MCSALVGGRRRFRRSTTGESRGSCLVEPSLPIGRLCLIGRQTEISVFPLSLPISLSCMLCKLVELIGNEMKKKKGGGRLVIIVPVQLGAHVSNECGR